jgi:hypothetical protein
MKYSIISSLGFAGAALAHGIVTDIEIASSDWYSMYNPYSTPYLNPVPELIGWTLTSNGP